MSIALDTTRGIDPSGIPTGVVSYVSVFKAPEIVSVVRRVFDGGDVLGTEKLDACRSSSSSSSSSSIGRNSDLSERSSDGEDSGENEAQSSYKGPLDMMDSLEEVLPIRRGISKFYNGKSKSFTNLGEGSTTCAVKDIAKPENAYIRKCRNRMAFNHGWDKNRSFPRRSNNVGISKRPIMTPSCSSLALAVAMGNSDSYSSEDSSNSGSNSRSPPRLPPLHPRSRASNGNLASLSTNPPQSNFSPWRSYSLADLQECSINTENIACNRPK